MALVLDILVCAYVHRDVHSATYVISCVRDKIAKAL